MDEQSVELTGSLAIRPKGTKKMIIYSQNDSTVYNIPDRAEYSYSGFIWLNKKDSLLCVENIETSRRVPIKSNVVLLDNKGTIIRNITLMEKGEFIQKVFPSPHDNYLFITFMKNENKKVSDIFTAPISAFVIGFKDNELIRYSNNISPRINFDINESPWSPDETKIVYSIIPKQAPIVIGEKQDKGKEINPGIYIYDFSENKHTKILDAGHNAVWSPMGRDIAYINNNSIYLYNTLDKTTKILYNGDGGKIELIHWTSEGKYLLVIEVKHRSHFDISINESFVNVVSGEIIHIQEPKFGLNNFTWKGSIKIID